MTDNERTAVVVYEELIGQVLFHGESFLKAGAKGRQDPGNNWHWYGRICSRILQERTWAEQMHFQKLRIG